MNGNPITRRDFGKQLMVAGAAATLSASFLQGCGSRTKSKLPIALQLYTVRDLMKDDFPGTLTQVAKIGYQAVEFAGFGGLSVQEVKKLLTDLQLECAGSHVGFEQLESGLESTLAFHQEIGCKYVVCPSMPGSLAEKGVEGIREFAAKLNEIGAKLKEAGVQLCYHNHSFEFKMVEDKLLIDHLFAAADPQYVRAEVDVYWVQHGGQDPAAFLRKYAGRCPLLHMKDMTGGEKKTFAPVGTGILDMRGIVRAAKETGAVWYIVEQDRSEEPILQAIATSLKNMKELLQE